MTIHGALRPVEHRVERECDSCHQWDTDPHHVSQTAQGIFSKHMDCCAADGCHDGSCNKILTDAGQKNHGADLVKHVVASMQPQDHSKDAPAFLVHASDDLQREMSAAPTHEANRLAARAAVPTSAKDAH